MEIPHENQNLETITFINDAFGANIKYVIDNENNLWFKAKEISTILGYKN